jgi:hypothetical protein
MPHRGNGGPPKADPNAELWAKVEKLADVLADVRAEVAAAKQATHDVKGQQQNRIAAEVFAAKAPIQQRMTMFQAVISMVVGVVGLGIVAIGGINAYAGWQVQGREVTARIAALEAWRTEIVALNLPLRMQTVEGNSETGRRIVDQRLQGLSEQVAQLRQSDSAATLQNQELLRSNAQLTTRIEDILRQLAEIKAQLSRGAFFNQPARPGNDEAPARWAPAEQHI